VGRAAPPNLSEKQGNVAQQPSRSCGAEARRPQGADRPLTAFATREIAHLEIAHPPGRGFGPGSDHGGGGLRCGVSPYQREICEHKVIHRDCFVRLSLLIFGKGKSVGPFECIAGPGLESTRRTSTVIPHTVELDQNQSSVKALQPQGTAGPKSCPVGPVAGESGWLNPAARGRAVSGAQVRSG
jgi:hypothetical protein